MKAIKNLIKRIFFLQENQNFDALEIMKTWNKKFGKYYYKKKYNTNDIINKFKDFKIREGDNIFLQSSWDLFYNYTDEPEDLINGILKLIGSQGTLAMPAFPMEKLLKNNLFDVRRSVTGAGIVCETFRKYPNVIRSVSVEHSVCALGPLAEYLINENFKSTNRFDEYSPYYKIIKKNFKIIGLGLSRYFIGTSAHCVHYICRNEIPYYAQLYNNISYKHFSYKDYDGNIKTYKSMIESKNLRSNILRTRHIVKKYFNKKEYFTCKLSNLTMCCYNSGYMYNRLRELANKKIYQFHVEK